MLDPSQDEVDSDSTDTSPSDDTTGQNKSQNAAQRVLTSVGNKTVVKAAQTVANTVDYAKKIAIAAKAGWGWISTTAIAIFNPVGLIVTAVVFGLVLLLISGIATSNLVGKNENANGCLAPNSGKGNGISVNASDDTDQNANAMGGWFMSAKFSFLGDKSMSKKQAAAIVGNFHAEGGGVRFAISEGNDATRNKMSNKEADAWSAGGARGLGLAQWTHNPGRAKNLIDTAEGLGKQWHEAEPQLELIKKELDGSYGARLLSAGFGDDKKSAGELAIIFHDIYEVSNDTTEMKDRRSTAANDFEKNFTGYNGGETGGSCLQDSTGGKAVGCDFPDAGYDICGAIELAYKEVGTTRATGFSMPGECIMSVKRWMEDGGGVPSMGGGSPRSQWVNNGMKEIPVKDARPGDVIQWINQAESWDSGVHTLLVTANNGDGTFNIVESNALAGPGTVGKQDNVTFEGPGNSYSWNSSQNGYKPHAFRLSK